MYIIREFPKIPRTANIHKYTMQGKLTSLYKFSLYIHIIRLSENGWLSQQVVLFDTDPFRLFVIFTKVILTTVCYIVYTSNICCEYHVMSSIISIIYTLYLNLRCSVIWKSFLYYATLYETKKINMQSIFTRSRY